MNKTLLIASLLVLGGAAQAKLPAPPAPTPEAAAKAEEAKARAAHAAKVEAFKLCQSMDRAAANHFRFAAAAGKPAQPSAGAPACADPGAFVGMPAAPAAAPAGAKSAEAKKG